MNKKKPVFTKWDYAFVLIFIMWVGAAMIGQNFIWAILNVILDGLAFFAPREKVGMIKAKKWKIIIFLCALLLPILMILGVYTQLHFWIYLGIYFLGMWLGKDEDDPPKEKATSKIKELELVPVSQRK